MEVAELKEYLAMIIDTEESLRVQKEALNCIKREYDTCDSRIANANRFITEAKKPKISAGEKIGEIIAFIVVTAIVFGVAFFIAWVVFYVLYDFDYIKVNPAFPAVGVGALFVLFEWVLAGSDKNNKLKKETEQFDEDMRKNKLEISLFTEKKNQLKDQLDKMQALVKNDEILLNQLYSCDFIHPKYKTLPFVTLIYECLDTGRCDRLEGPEGAYNRVELDYRLDNISKQLGAIISSLGDIRGIISGMRRDVSQLSRWTQSIGGSIEKMSKEIQMGNEVVDKLASNTELLTYQQERIAREIEYSNRINYLQGRNNVSVMGIDVSRPPHMSAY